ncbi:KamA family radical SAM protein [Microaerobacter geothermalis]|uniref:KamA family radical SAM protein n=1 Tax=Microaerobacter geothermalis TaxID=674972 RepID=UPI001F3C0D2D|nr:KamA family radical SAM protein [Microaerobacter geothermalis]MCF6094712.1 KamA family radical SAM protein [Microaerobacter geothermalis]
MRYITDIRKLERLTNVEKEKLAKITDKFVFRINDYYLSLIDWEDPDDPIRKLIIPNESELEEYGKWDASDEHTNYVAKGCQHKYSTTALLLVSEVCGAYCRFCFRKRLFRNDVKEISMDVKEGVEYIANHPEINNVLLTGGDSLILATKKIESILHALRQIPHVKIIRMGSKLPAFNPMRIYEDEELLNVLSKYSRPDARIHVMAHFNHPREITEHSYKAIAALQKAGVIVVNQTPVLKGVNGKPEVLAELLNKLSWAGVTPYYFFQNRPVAGNASFVLTFAEAYDIIEKAKAMTSGLGKRVKYVMSHSSGKIEILAVQDGKIYLKYHQARNPEDYGKFMIYDLPEGAAWFDDLPDAMDQLDGEHDEKLVMVR